jgi:hypothetical protein
VEEDDLEEEDDNLEEDYNEEQKIAQRGSIQPEVRNVWAMDLSYC